MSKDGKRAATGRLSVHLGLPHVVMLSVSIQ
jgi:hypothetical protein